MAPTYVYTRKRPELYDGGEAFVASLLYCVNLLILGVIIFAIFMVVRVSEVTLHPSLAEGHTTNHYAARLLALCPKTKVTLGKELTVLHSEHMLGNRDHRQP